MKVSAHASVSLARFLAVISLVLCLIACTLSGESQVNAQQCGSGQAPERLSGLFWLLGEPGKANVLCSVQGNEFRQVYVLEPDSRDPLLLEDKLTQRILLIERFSGSAARPSRATWFSPAGEQLSQSGDWPQNTYAALRLSDSEGLATGFDLAQIQHFLMPRSQDVSLGQLTEKQFLFPNFNPIVTLQNGAWLALISSGFDLLDFSAKEAQVMRVSEGKPHSDGLVSVSDSVTREQCKNAFQTLQISNSKVVLSCNPQYFGPVADELVALFEVELGSDGQLSMRILQSANGSDVQRIDLLGLDDSGLLFVGVKKTMSDDYNGEFIKSGFLSLTTLQFTTSKDIRGPLFKTASGERVFFCVESSSLCEQGEFFLNETEGESSIRIPTRFTLPFLSFPASIQTP